MPTETFVNGDGPHVENQALPHSLEAEEAVLGGLIIDPDAYHDVAAFLKPEHFYKATNGQIYKAVSDLHRESVGIDLLTLSETLEARKVKVKDGTAAYLAGLINAVPTSINTRHYGRIVEAAAMRRQLIRAAGKIATLAHNDAGSVAGLIEQSERVIFEVTQRVATENVVSIKQSMRELLAATEQRHDAGGQLIGLPTGFIDLDWLLKGLKKQSLYVLAGRPGMGKSALEGAISLHLARQGHRIGRFNLEMSGEQISQRLVALESGLPFDNIERGDLADHHWPIFMEAVGRLSEMRIWTDDTASLTISQLHAKCQRLHAEHGLDLVTVDYLQLMTGDGKAGNRTQEIGQISRSLKKLAKSLDIPVLALAQLNRSVEQRADKHPHLSDLRESGDIENDADAVMFLYRDEYYFPDTSERPGIAEVNVAKHRNGKVGTVDLYFNGPLMRFGSLQRQEVNV